MLPRLLIAGFCLLSLLAGCGGGGASSPTEGFAVELQAVQRTTNLAVYYSLRTNGDLAYNAGSGILSTGDPTAFPLWTTTLTREQASPIVAWLRETDIPEPPESDDQSLPSYRVNIGRPDKTFVRTIDGPPSPWTIELRRRFDAIQKQLRETPPPYPQLTPAR